MKSSVSKIFVVIVIILLLCTGGIFLYLKNSKPVDTFSVALIGKNEFQSTLKVELINPKFELDNYEYQWWYSDNGSDEKINIEGATTFQYKIETGMVGKYIGVDVFEKGKSEVLIETVANKKDNGTDTVSPIISEISLKNKKVSYNGNFVSIGKADVSSDAKVNYTYYIDNKCMNKTGVDSGATYDGGEPIDVGVYYAKAYIDDSLDYKAASSECAMLEIKPAVVSVVWSNINLKYNGSNQSPVAVVDNNITNEQVNVLASTAINAGIYTSEAKCVDVIGGRGKCSNFSLINDTSEFEISKIDPVIELAAKKETYSGKPIFANEVTTSFEGDVTYTYYTDSLCTKKTTNDVGVAIEGSAPVDAGMYYVKAKLDATGNSNEAITKCVPHIIEPKVIDVKWEQTEFTYNGEYKVPTVSAISGVNDEAFIFTTSKEFEPGIYPTSAECFSVNGGRGKCSNYWFKNNTNTFKINKAQPTVSLSSKAVLYNGSPISAYDAITNSGGNISYRYYIDNMCTNEVSFENGGIPIDAGNYYVKAFVGESEYYTNGYSGCVSHKIIPVSVDVNINNNSFVYDGSKKNITYSTSYVKVNDEKIIMNVDGKVEPGVYSTSPYCASVSNGRGKCSNYKFKIIGSDELNITKAIGSVSLDTYTKEYNGLFDSVKYSTNSDGISKVSYYSDSNCTNEITSPVEVGNYYTKVSVDSSSRYTDVVSLCSLYSITKKEVNVNWIDGTYIYNGDEQGPSASIDLVDGSTYNLDTTKSTDAGEYVSEITNDLTKYPLSNYSLKGNTHNYNIKKTNPVITVLENINLIYPNVGEIIYEISSGEYSKVNCHSDDSSIVTCKIEDSKLKIIPTGDGDTTIIISNEESKNYSSISKVINVHVAMSSYQVRLNINDGLGNVLVEDVEYGNEFVIPSVNSNYGDYKLLGWSLVGDNEIDYSVGDKIIVTRDVNLYAVWKDMILINEDFTGELDPSLNISMKSSNGNYQIIDEQLQIINNSTDGSLTEMVLSFVPKYNSRLSFDFGRYISSGNNILSFTLNGSDGSSEVLYYNTDISNYNGNVTSKELDAGVTYELNVSYLSDGSAGNYAYLDNLKVELVDELTDSLSGEESSSSLSTSFIEIIKNLWNSICEFFKNLFK